jgi:hypothetical protein
MVIAAERNGLPIKRAVWNPDIKSYTNDVMCEKNYMIK